MTFSNGLFLRWMSPEVKCFHLMSSGLEMCTSRVGNAIYHKFSQYSTSCMLSGKSINIIVYTYGRRLCNNMFQHGSTTISYPQCSLTFLRERYLRRCCEQSFATHSYAMRAVGIDVVSSHTKYCRIAYSITR